MKHNSFGEDRFFDPLVCLKQEDQTDTDIVSEVEDLLKDDDGEGEGNIMCRNCYNIIAKSSDRIPIHGADKHIFANPHGHVFEIVCVKNVTGCGHTGMTTDEFSWFKGYSWKIAVCRSCLVHLGWAFMGIDGDLFHGLILNQIVESRSASSKGVY